MELILELLQDVLSWLCIGALGWIIVQIKLIIRHTKLQESATKTLMRADLIKRYTEWRDNGGWVSDENKQEWLADYGTYHELAGRNGFLDAAYNNLINMPAHAPDDGKE